MACVKLGSKSDAFQRQGQAWFCTTGLPSDVVVEVGEMSFHLHKFPLLSRSGVMEKLIAEAPTVEHSCVVSLPDVPGGPKTFELIARFCYGIKLELTVSNAAHLRCAAEYLEMTEDYGEGNLISQTESFINQVILRGWKDSLRTLQMCEDILPHSERLQIPRRCIESLATRACSCTDPNLFSGPITEHGGPMQSPGGSVLWNGISTGARVKNPATDWWYEDASTLSLPLYKRLLAAMEAMGMRQEIIAGSLDSYAKKHLPVLSRRHTDPGGKMSTLSEEDQRALLEEIDRLLPMQKGLVPTKSLFGLLRTAKILKVDPGCVSSLEKRIGLQLDEARLEDLLMTNLSYSVETLYDVDFVQRVLEHFLRMDRAAGDESPGSVDDGRLMGSPSLTPIMMVTKLIDGYLAEVATDVNLKLPKFRSLAAAVPEYARPLDDGLYHAIDLYLKSHPWLAEAEREDLCRLIDCQKLSLEACTHATQNERLPLRVIIQVLFFEQLQLRTSITGCYLISGNLDGSRGLNEGGGRWATAEALRAGMDNMRVRVGELERECWSMRREIERMGRSVRWSSAWERVSTKLGFGLKTQICSAEEGSVRRGDVKGEKKNKKTKKKVVLGE